MQDDLFAELAERATKLLISINRSLDAIEYRQGKV